MTATTGLPTPVPAPTGESTVTLVNGPNVVGGRRYLILAALQVLDVATTWWILRHWTARGEANPVVRAVIETVGLNVGCIMLLAAKLGIVYLLYRRDAGVKIVTAIYTIVIANNLLFLALWYWQ